MCQNEEYKEKEADKVKALRTLRKNWILVWLLIVCLMLGSLVAFGAYTGVTTAKRVVSLSSHDGILFTSKYMSRNNIGVQPAIFVYDDEKTDEQQTICRDLLSRSDRSVCFARRHTFCKKSGKESV